LRETKYHLEREQKAAKKTWNVLQEAWRTVPENYLKKLQENSSQRVQAVLKNKGAQTKYSLLSALDIHLYMIQ